MSVKSSVVMVTVCQHVSQGSVVMPTVILLQDKPAVEAADETHVAADRPQSSSTLSTRLCAVGGGGAAAQSGARELLSRSVEVLRQGIQDICEARDSVIDANGCYVADVSWLKVRSGVCTCSKLPTEPCPFLLTRSKPHLCRLLCHPV